MMNAAEIALSLFFAAALGIPVACASWTVTMEKVFEDFRRAATNWGKRHPNNWFIQKLSYLPTCYYCFSHWVGFVAMVAFPFKMLTHGARGYIPALLATILFANVYMSLFNILRARLRMQRGMADEAEIKVKIVKAALRMHREEATESEYAAPVLAS